MMAMTKQKRSTEVDDGNWHLDKKVPVAIIAAMLIQTGGIVWWAAQTAERLSNVERRIEVTAPQADRLTRVEVKVDNLVDGVTEIKSILRKDPKNK